MSEVKRMPIEEFRRLGYLQEANRLFFHPHGLALEVTIVDEDGWADDNPRVVALAEHLIERRRVDHEDDPPGSLMRDATMLAQEVLHDLYPPGSVFLSGVWDYRDDPEGIVFGDDLSDKREKAERVVDDRRAHFAARAALFGRPGVARTGVDFELDAPDLDVEPLDWTLPEAD